MNGKKGESGWALMHCVWFSRRHRTCVSMACLERRRSRRARDREWSTPGTEATTSNPSSTEPSWSSQRWPSLHPKPPALIQRLQHTLPMSVAFSSQGSDTWMGLIAPRWTMTSSQSSIYSDTWVWSRGRVFHSVFLRKCSFVIGCDALLTSALWNCATNTLETHQIHGVPLNHIRLIQNICNLRFIKSTFIKLH